MANFETIGLARGYELKENVVVNKGFYCVAVGDRDDAPTTFPTAEQAWERCCAVNHLIPTVRKVCGTCGSEDVVLDAWAEWDIESQEWVLGQTFDQAFCNACEGECTIEDSPLASEDDDDPDYDDQGNLKAGVDHG